MQKTKLKAILKERIKLNRDDYKKNIYHLSLEIDDESFNFKTGSCVAIHPQNPKCIVEALFTIIKTDSSTLVMHPKSGQTMAGSDYFLNHVNFHQTRKSLVEHIFNKRLPLQEAKELTSLDLLTFLELVKDNPPKLEDLVKHTAPILPRYYSISSSQKVHKNKLDLMVSTLNMDHRHIKTGIASGYLTNQVQINDKISFSYHANEKFSLIDCQDTPIIMIGPGTGLAPFRGFLQELATRKNPKWLFTGSINKKDHFYYQDELEEHQENGLKLSLAFSREQEHKIYVQHLMQQESKLLFDWIDKKNAHIYICGDAKKMAKDVQETLMNILMKHKRFDLKEAREYLKQMRKNGRLRLDVY